ncbi:hypothetical protein ACOMHN_053906 [Nucella lapillus]
MNGIEEAVVEKKDHSRPFFPRNMGEVGLYVDVDEATCIDAHAYGSDHLMRVEMNEKLGEQLTKCDLVKVKGELDRRGHFRGVVLEEFRRGTILAVIFNSVEALQSLQKLHEGKQLSSLFQAILVDQALLEVLNVRKLTVRVRMWPDEFEVCQAEILKILKDKKRVDIISRPRDVSILHQVQQYQREKSTQLREQLQDAVSQFEGNLREFLVEVKQALPQQTTKLATLKEFQTNMKVAIGASVKQSKAMQQVKDYLSTLELVRTWLAQAEIHLCLPLLLIPACCETEKQRELKRQMKASCMDGQKMLKPAVSLKEMCFKEWEAKLLPREKTLFLGLISLLPLGLECVTDVDQSLDEYVNNFPSFTPSSIQSAKK